MVNGGFYRNVNCYFTNEGRTTFAKQDNGIKFSKLGAVIFSDKNRSLITAIKNDNIAAINNISLKQLNTYTQLIFRNVKYEYSNNTYTPVNTSDVDKAINDCINYLGVEISYDNQSEENYFSYDFTLRTDSLNIDKNEYDDLNFDGFALLGIPYKSSSEETTINGLIEPQTPAVLAIIYFKDDTEKLQIVHNQPDVAAMTVELHISLEDEIYLGAISEYVDTMGNPVENNIATRNLVGLRQVNDGQNNRNSNVVSHGSDANVFITNMSTDTTTAYDSFAKLNIMTEAVNDLSEAVPQIMLAQTTSGVSEKIWNGDRLNIKYTSGNDCGYFSISEVTGTTRQRISLDLFGQQNIYHTVVSGDYGNSFIYSRLNTLTDDDTYNSFIHSDYNTFENRNMSGFGFFNSNYNTIRATTGALRDQKTFARNIGLYNSNYNTIHPKYYESLEVDKSNKKSWVYQKGLISNSVLLNSNYNYIKGRSTIPYDDENYIEHNSTFINSLSSMYTLQEHHNLTMVGGTFNFINNTNGDVIGIGEGLLQDEGEGDRIILGHYNRNTVDPNDVLIVGDGRMKMSYIKGLLSGTKNWYKNRTKLESVMVKISEDGSPDKDSDYYRHNIFTVNKEGYITISDYDTNKSARYGFNGITSYDAAGKEQYKIPFSKIYDSLNVQRTYDENRAELEAYEEAAANLIYNSPQSFNQIISNKNDSNTTFSAYLNFDDITETNNTTNITLNGLADYTVCNFIYIPVAATSYPMCLVWNIKLPGETELLEKHTLIKPYTTTRLIYLPQGNQDTVFGFSEIL